MLEAIENYDYWAAVLHTLELTLWGALWALIIGTVIAIMRLSPVRVLQWAGAMYVTLIRNTPLTMIVVAANFVIWTQLKINLADPQSATYIVDNGMRLGILAIAVYHASFVCEAIRAGVNTIPLGQAEAARSLGMTFGQSLTQVILPQAFRGAITPLGNVLIALTKNTTVVVAIGVAQVSHAMRRMIEFRPDLLFEIFGLVALTFVVITLPMGLATSWAAKRWAVQR